MNQNETGARVDIGQRNQTRRVPHLSTPGSWITLSVVLTFWCVTVIVSLAAYSPLLPGTPNQETTVPQTDKLKGEASFSVDQAMSYLQQLVGDSIPHPSGSRQNAVVRERVIGILRSQGYDVSTQVGTVDVPARARRRTNLAHVELHNIIAMKKGVTEGKAIALVTHFDSVASGPGASDDGVGLAAALEIARLFSAAPAPRRDIVFLVTDGEEFGLLGAKLFADKHPLMDEIGLVINLEARGTSGASLMFETSPMSRPLIPLYARSSAKPVSSSLFREVYKRMPNNTDFSVFDQHGKLGFNFAFIGDVRDYHTPADNFQNVDQGSLNHHGQNALALILEIQDAEHLDDLLDRDRENWNREDVGQEAVYFDFFGWFLVWWPQSWSPVLTLGAALCFVAASAMIGPNEREQGASMVGAVGAIAFLLFLFAVLFVVIIGVGWGFQWLLQLDPQLSHPWPRTPAPILVSFWALGLALVSGCACLLGDGFKPINVWWSLGIYWVGMAAFVSFLLPGASYLFIVPILLTSVFAVVSRVIKLNSLHVWLPVLACFAGMVWLPMERLFFDAMGLKMPYVEFFRITVVSTTLMGCMAAMSTKVRFIFALTMVVVTVIAVLLALFL